MSTDTPREGRPGDRSPTEPKPVHGHTGPTTPGEEATRDGPLSDAEKARVAEQTSREEDA